MELIVAILSIVLLLTIIGLYIRGAVARTWDLLSWRNLFLLGFIHFYCLSAYFTATGTTLPEYLSLTQGGWAKLAVMMVLFLAVFLGAASYALRRPNLARVLPKVEVPVTAPALVVSIVALSLGGLFFSIPIFNYFGVLVAQIRGQLGACAVGLATYYLVARRFNPIAWLLFFVALAMGTISSTVGLPGRRLLLGVMLAVPWMWYFVVWRYRRPASNLARVAVFFVVGVIGLIMYSPLRDMTNRTAAEEATISKRVEQFTDLLTNPRIDPTVIKYILYADTVPNTLYVLENYPGNHSFKPFHGLIWFFSNPIPRTVWPGKPEAFGAILRDQMNVPPNLGPGIIAHGWQEAWVIGVVLYAVFFGLLVGMVDRASADRCWNPYFLAVFGGNLGNVIALPRGDTPLFMIQIVGGVVASGLFLYLLKTISPVWASFPMLLPPGAAQSGQDAMEEVATDPAEEPELAQQSA